jgi:signal transduction histidine kinase
MDLAYDRLSVRTPQLPGGAIEDDLERYLGRLRHDLRSPVLTINGFAQALLEDYEAKLDDAGKEYLERLRGATQRINLLMADLEKRWRKEEDSNQTVFGFY